MYLFIYFLYVFQGSLLFVLSSLLLPCISQKAYFNVQEKQLPQNHTGNTGASNALTWAVVDNKKQYFMKGTRAKLIFLRVFICFLGHDFVQSLVELCQLYLF